MGCPVEYEGTMEERTSGYGITWKQHEVSTSSEDSFHDLMILYNLVEQDVIAGRSFREPPPITNGSSAYGVTFRPGLPTTIRFYSDI